MRTTTARAITIGFGTLPSGVTAVGTTTTTVSLVDDDDPAVTVRFGEALYEATEGGTAATVEVEMSADPERDVIVPLVVDDIGHAVAADFTFSPTEVMFVAAGPTTKSITVTANDDDVDNASRRIFFGFGALPDGVTKISHSQTVVELIDNDDVQLTATFEASSYSATEGGAAVTIKVTLSEAPSAGNFPRVEPGSDTGGRRDSGRLRAVGLICAVRPDADDSVGHRDSGRRR